MINTETDTITWKETNHGRTMSEALIELKRNNFFQGKRILELGGGIANHTIIMLENHPELLVTTEINEERLEVTRGRVGEHFTNKEQPCCEFRVADWLDTHGTFDVVITNPPYFMSGKYNRRYFIDELILNSHRSLNPDGYLIFVQSSMADIDITKSRMEENGFTFEVLHQKSYPWRDYYFQDPRFLKMCDENPKSHFLKNGERWETLFVVHGKLLEFDTKFTH